MLLKWSVQPRMRLENCPRSSIEVRPTALLRYYTHTQLYFTTNVVAEKYIIKHRLNKLNKSLN